MPSQLAVTRSGEHAGRPTRGARGFSSARAWLLPLGVVVMTVVAALPAEAQLPRGVRIDDAGGVSFDARDGLPSSVIYDVIRRSDGVLWAATEDGPYQQGWTGWQRVRHPDSLVAAQVRMIAEGPDGALWFAGRGGVYRFLDGAWTSYRDDEGIPKGTNYSVAVTSALDGSPVVVVGSARGLYRLSPTGRFVDVPLPDGFDPKGLMVATRAERDGTESLWLASITAGIARYQRGAWQVWGAAHGLEPIVEAVAPGAADDSVEALAATYRGAFQLVRGRWSAISSPALSINRVLRVRTGGRYESWLGSVSGLVLRDHGVGVLDIVHTGSRGSTSPVIAFRARDDGIGDATVYVGFRGGGLSRIRTGRAGRVLVNGTSVGGLITAIGEVGERDGTSQLLTYRLGRGVNRSLYRSTDRVSSPESRSDYYVNSFADTRTSGGALWAGSAVGPLRLAGSVWAPDPTAPFPVAPTVVVAGPLPDGNGDGLLASTAPLSFRDRTGWRVFPGAPSERPRFMIVDTLAGEQVLWVATAEALHRYTYRTKRWATLGPLTDATVPELSGVNAHRLDSGEEVVWVSSVQLGVGLIRADSALASVRWIDPNRNKGMPSFVVTSMVVGPDGRVFAGTSRGLVTMRPGSRYSDSVAIEDVYAQADGLPHEQVLGVSLSRDQGVLWVTTVEGLGVLSLRRGTRAPEHQPALRLAARAGDAAPREVRQDDHLSFAERSVVLEYTLDTRQREELTRYRMEFDGRPATREEWSALQSISLPALGAGRHEARLWAMDWRGRVVGPVTLGFIVAPPPWRSPLALLLYALALAVLLLLADRWRQAALKARADELEANERRLAASEERFRRLFDDGADAQLLVRESRVIAANPAAASMLGNGQRESLVGLRLEALLPANVPLQARSGDDPPPSPVETKANAADGTVIPVAARRTAIPAATDPFEHLELRDLRETRRHEHERALLEQQLRESQRLEALGNLAGGVAHDFNNLLTVIQGHAELLRAVGARATEDADSLTAILHASDRARGIVRQILTFSRRQVPRREEVDLGAMLRETGRMLRASIPTTVSVLIDDRAHDATMFGDPTEMHQLLLNLGANAEYAMRDTNGGTLAFTLDLIPSPTGDLRGRPWPTATCLRLRVRDTGIGMSPDVQERIFEPFFTTKPVGEGTGLGLSVLHGIVVAHDGTVDVASAPGQGTTFEIHFPALEPSTPRADRPPPASAVPLRRDTHGSILIVDDEVAVAGVTALLLESAGYRTTRCFSPSEALKALESPLADFDLVITDQAMPGMTGDLLAERVHRLNPNLPVIIATGFSRKLLTLDLTHLGVRRILEKPFLEEELLAAVSEALVARRH